MNWSSAEASGGEGGNLNTAPCAFACVSQAASCAVLGSPVPPKGPPNANLVAKGQAERLQRGCMGRTVSGQPVATSYRP